MCDACDRLTAVIANHEEIREALGERSFSVETTVEDELDYWLEQLRYIESGEL
jgi:hypothetical protein